MKCDLCDNEATVHEVTVRNGVKVERHLCERCAQGAGVSVPGQGSVQELLKLHVTLGQKPVQGAVRPAACPMCRLTFAEFKQHGQLGCPECYRTYESQVGPLMERWHEGGIRHVGKTPKRLARSVGEASVSLEDRAERLRRIREDLDRAVKAEQYEQAARLRDELRRLAQPGSSP